MKPQGSGGFRVLITDDEEPVRRFVARVLQRPGYETVTAADGFEAVKIAAGEKPFDLLVTDLMMPGMSGADLAQCLRLANPALKILYLTGYSDRLFQERHLLSDGEAFLDKPVTIPLLLEAATLLLVGHIPPPRPARVNVPGACVRLPTELADLVSLSVTGVLVHGRVDVAVGMTWPLVIELPLETISVTGRVVRCQSVGSAEKPDGQKRYAVAITFLAPTADALRALQRVCRTDATTAAR
jgi:CheY-like chemotaxis protein